ncbi:MAG: hypothetical protein AAGI48_06210 [Verrucomicrobiota bacterium]
MSTIRRLPPENPHVISFRGPDAVRFLNGQVTQDVSDLGQRTLRSCITDAKGRLQFFVDLCMGPDDSHWVVCPAAHCEGLHERLERYLIADDVEVEDLGGSWWRVHASAPDAGNGAEFSRSAVGCFGDGVDSWWKAKPILDSLDPAEAEDLRIAARIPSMGHELEAGLLPPEAGLDRNAISYSKGCYIGQEVLSRIKSAGKINRRLAAFDLNGEASAGDALLADSKEVGVLTSIARTVAPGDPRPALGYLKKAAYEHPAFTVSDTDGNPKGSATRTAWA